MATHNTSGRRAKHSMVTCDMPGDATYGSAFEAAQKKAIIEPFMAKNDIKVVTDSPTDLAKLKVMVQTGKVTWDLYLADQQQPVGFCDKLFDIDENLNIVPQLALSHETSADGKQVTYDMKANRSDPTAVGTKEYAAAIVERL